MKRWFSRLGGIAALLIVGVLVYTLWPSAPRVEGSGLLSIRLSSRVQMSPQPIGEVVEKRTQNNKTYYLGNNEYTIRASVGTIHYKDTQGNWQNIDPLTFEADTGDFTAKFTKLPYLIRIGNDSYRRIYPDRNDLSYWISIGKPFSNMGTPTKIDNTWIWDFTNASLSVAIWDSSVKLTAILKNDKAPSSMTFPFGSEGIYRDGGLLYHNGQLVGVLKAPFAVDANGIERDLIVTWGSGTVTISLVTAGLTYPIEVDPTYYVGASNDDRSETGVALFAANDPILYVYAYTNTASSLYRCSGQKYNGIGIPPGSNVTSAYEEVYIYNTSFDSIATNIYFNDVDDANDFVAEAAIIARVRTSANVTWQQINVAAGGAAYFSTPSLVALVQEVVNRPGWASGQDMATLWIANTDAGHSTWNTRYDSWDAAGTNQTRLTISYTAAGGEPDITNTPSYINFGTVHDNSTYWSYNTTLGYTPTWPLTDGQATFNLTNVGQGTVNVSINSTNFIGGVGWVLSTVQGTDQAVLKAGYSNQGDINQFVTLNGTLQTFITGMVSFNTTMWELALYTPTVYTDAAAKSALVYLVASNP